MKDRFKRSSKGSLFMKKFWIELVPKNWTGGISGF